MASKFEGPSRLEGDAAFSKLEHAKKRRMDLLEHDERAKRSEAGKSLLDKFRDDLSPRNAGTIVDLGRTKKELGKAQKGYDKVVGSAKEAAWVMDKKLENLAIQLFRQLRDVAEWYPYGDKGNGPLPKEKKQEDEFRKLINQAANLGAGETLEATLMDTKFSIFKSPSGDYEASKG